MIFTDDDLKRLNAHLRERHEDLKDSACDELTHEIGEALLVRLECAETQRDVFKEMYERQAFRLEAAENVIQICSVEWSGDGSTVEERKAIKAWRKAAGK